MSAEAANSEKSKVKLGGLASVTDGPAFDDLPENLRHLIRRSLLLQERVRRLDSLLHPLEMAEGDNPVARQIGRISAALNLPRLP